MEFCLNCANVDTSMKFGTSVLQGVLNHFRGLAILICDFFMMAILNL